MSQINWAQVNRIFQNIKGTINYGIVHKKKNNNLILKENSDADFPGSHDTKSTSGYMCLINNCIVSYCSRRQLCVTL